MEFKKMKKVIQLKLHYCNVLFVLPPNSFFYHELSIKKKDRKFYSVTAKSKMTSINGIIGVNFYSIFDEGE